MNASRLLASIVVLSVLANAYDYLVHNLLLRATYQEHQALLNAPQRLDLLIFADIVWVVLFCWFYAAFARGRKFRVSTGIWFGFFVGLIAGWMPQVYSRLVLAGFPIAFYLSWGVANLVRSLLLGAAIGRLYRES
jgi:hypothetical protein